MNTKESDTGCGIEDYYDSEYLEFINYCQKVYEKTKERLVAADCRSAAKRLKQYMAQFTTSQTSTRIMDVDWVCVLDSLLELYCRDAILNQIKHTQKNARGKWTKELLDRKIEICGLGETTTKEIYEAAEFELNKRTFKNVKFSPNEAEPIKEIVTFSEHELAISG